MKPNSSLTVEWTLDDSLLRGRTHQAAPAPAAPVARLPRIARLMALAIKFDGMIREGAVTDYADLARLGLVTRARMTQIMNLLNLAPDIQEEILFLPRNGAGKDPVAERNLRPLVAVASWNRQRTLWRNITKIH